MLGGTSDAQRQSSLPRDCSALRTSLVVVVGKRHVCAGLDGALGFGARFLPRRHEIISVLAGRPIAEVGAAPLVNHGVLVPPWYLFAVSNLPQIRTNRSFAGTS
jgi:hypothetical protein